MNTDKKILVVDDSSTDRLSVVKALRALGFANIREATNGDEGIAKAKAERPDLVIMDIVMPGVSGFQATRSITQHDATIPVVITSSKDRAPDKMNAQLSGAKDYIVKPVSAEAIAKVCSQFC